MSKVYFSIGSNKGNRSQLINEAIDKIDISIGKVEQKSSIYETQSWGFKSNNFLKIEKDMGRLKSGNKYSDRCIDIDILFVEDIIVNSKNLIIPHPRLHLRKFVLTPMLDLAPDLIHPILNKSIKQLELECDDNDQPKKID